MVYVAENNRLGGRARGRGYLSSKKLRAIGTSTQLRIPGELHSTYYVPLKPCLVDRSFPALILHPALYLRALAEPLHHTGHKLILGSAARYEVLGRLLVQIFQLDPFTTGEMVRNPCLATLGFASDPVTHDHRLVGVALQLDDLEIVEHATTASAYPGVRRHGFGPEIESWQFWDT